MVKVNLLMSEDEAKKYFSKDPLLNFAWIKRVKPVAWLIVAAVICFSLLLFIIMNNVQRSEYQKGFNDGTAAMIDSSLSQDLMNQSVDYVWQWFEKKFLISLGLGLPSLFLLMAIVWIVHGSFFKLG